MPSGVLGQKDSQVLTGGGRSSRCAGLHRWMCLLLARAQGRGTAAPTNHWQQSRNDGEEGSVKEARAEGILGVWQSYNEPVDPFCHSWGQPQPRAAGKWGGGGLLGVQDENTVFALGGGIATEEVLECVLGTYPSSWYVLTDESVLANFM